ncbi:uncharacterized protein PG986_010651 [Apiospora aurea]|uniref:Zinc-binding domain-containing protein n=1 Tax=Apiospora aurea TaxID=335848 RepID=A0ABR1Q2Y6_9PEZI
MVVPQAEGPSTMMEESGYRLFQNGLFSGPAIPQSCHGCGRGEAKFADIWVASVRDLPGRYSKHHLKLRGNCDDCTAALGDKRRTKP